MEEKETSLERRCPALVEGAGEELQGPMKEIPRILEPVNAGDLLAMLGFSKLRAQDNPNPMSVVEEPLETSSVEASLLLLDRVSLLTLLKSLDKECFGKCDVVGPAQGQSRGAQKGW